MVLGLIGVWKDWDWFLLNVWRWNCVSKGKSNSFLSEKVSDTEETSRQNELILTKEKFELDVKRREVSHR